MSIYQNKFEHIMMALSEALIIQIQKLTFKMEADINEPKSKAFNIYLRIFQLGFQIVLGYWALKLFHPEECTQQYIESSTYIGYVVLFIGLVSIIVVRCSDRFPRVYFFLTYILFILLGIGIIVLCEVLGQQKQNNCASNKVLHRFFAAECVIAIFISILILCTKLSWGQRYSNHPGNLAWAVLFLGFSWTGKFGTAMEIIGIINALITFSSLFVNLMACGGTSSTVKRVIIFQWVIGLVFMVACEIYALILYIASSGENLTDFKDQMALRVLLVFIPVNIVDFIFWVLGLRTLAHENGDRIRDALFSGESRDRDGNQPEALQEENDGDRIGTINN